jgi:(2Fe-2S) ferredoxin
MSKITLFVCTHHRSCAEHPSCGARGSETLFQQLQLATKDCDVSVEQSTCFGHCANGVIVKISPNGSFYHHVTALDIPMLIADANVLCATTPSPDIAPSIEASDCLDID